LKEQRRNRGWRIGAHQPVFAVKLDTGALQPVEIAQERPPFGAGSGLGSQIVEVFLHDEGKEGAEYMAADGGIGGMVDRPCPHYCLGAAEQVFDLQEIAVAQHCLTRRDPRIGAQHEDAVKARLFCELAGVDLEGGLALGFLGLAQIAAVGGIADQRLVAALQLLLQARYDGLAILAVFSASASLRQTI